MLVNNRAGGACAVDGAGTGGDVARLEALGPQIHHRDYRHSYPSSNPVHYIPTPGSSAHMVFDMLAVSILLVAQPLDSASS